MEMKKMLLAATSIVIILLAVTVVTASPGTIVNTSLFAYRMEHHSSKMSFLPTEMNEFTYTAEQGYELTYDVPGYFSDVGPSAVETDTPGTKCDTCWTCPASCVRTCRGNTCPATSCRTCSTCWGTCGGSCNTCYTKPCKIVLVGS